MTLAELHRNFKIELDKSSISSYPSFLPEEIDYWINTAIIRLVKTKYSGLNTHQKGFQQNQKRTDDLRELVKTSNIQIRQFTVGAAYVAGDIIYVSGKYYKAKINHAATDLANFELTSDNDNCVRFQYPNDYMIGVGESAIIYSNSTCWPKTSNIPVRKRVDILEKTIENLDSSLNNSLSEHRLHGNKAKPIRVHVDGMIDLYTDGDYIIDKYSIIYIQNPPKLDIDVDDELTIFPEHVWDEILVLSVRLALENISEPRYQTFTSESQMVE